MHKRSRPPSRHLADTRDTNIIIFNCPYRTILQFSKTKYILYLWKQQKYKKQKKKKKKIKISSLAIKVRDKRR